MIADIKHRTRVGIAFFFGLESLPRGPADCIRMRFCSHLIIKGEPNGNGQLKRSEMINQESFKDLLCKIKLVVSSSNLKS